MKVHNTWTQSRVKQTHFFHIVSIITSHGLNNSLRSFFKSLCFSGPSIIMKRSNEGFRSPIATFQGCNQLFLKSLKLNLIKTYSLEAYTKAWTRILPKLGFFFKNANNFFLLFFQVTMKTSPYLVILFLKILAFTSLIGCVEGQFRSSNSLGVRKNNYR